MGLKILAQKEDDKITNSVRNAESLFIKQHKAKIDTTEKVFRTAYECAKSHLSFAEHSRLIELQSLNGTDCGQVLHSDHSCANIITHVASEMCTEIVKHVSSNNFNFSIMVDESTSVANVQSSCVHSYLYDNDTVYFS